jgi:hypothetical protein
LPGLDENDGDDQDDEDRYGKGDDDGEEGRIALACFGVGSLLERIGSVMVTWMHGRVFGFAFAESYSWASVSL